MLTVTDKSYQVLVANAPGAIMVTDPIDLQVLEANAAASDLTAYPLAQLKLCSLLDLFPATRHPELRDMVSAVRNGEAVAAWQGLLRTARDDNCPVSLTLRLVGEASDEQLAVYLGDESEQRRSEDVLRAQNDELVQTIAARTSDLVRTNADLQKALREANESAREAHKAAEAKSRFVATLTHELRTPLNALIGMSDLLLAMELGADQRETAEVVLESAEGLLLLVNDVLDFAKIEAGRMELRREEFRLAGTLAGVQDLFSPQFAEKGLELRYHVEDSVPAWLVGDEQRLRQVVVNLVSNALKFTAQGSVVVTAHAEPVGDETVKLYLNVTDTGCGIAPADQKGLFEPYTQVENQSQGATVGTGLGLNISRQLIELMGGQLKVISAVGRGATFGFNVTLPVGSNPAPEPEAPPAGAEKPTDAPAPSFSSRRAALHVLLAEDNRVNQTVALGMLRKNGFSGIAVENGREALAALAAEEFDLVFMDLQMPVLGGLEATRAIRSGEAGDDNRDIPIIAMTGHATRQDRQACLDAGMNGYVTKPISSERIVEAISDLAKPDAHNDHRLSPCNVPQLIEQMNGDRELASEILVIFCEDTVERLRQINEAMRNYDFNRAGDEALAIESGTANVCAEKMGRLARELQKAAAHKEQEYAVSLLEEMEAELARLPRQV